jgi:hypothetical protein
MKTYTEAEIVNMLRTNNYAVERALIALYNRQTATEQNAERTEVHNSMGFTAFDATIFTSFAKQVLSSVRPQGQRLSPRQLEICRKESAKGKMKIAKYARQLAEVANAKTESIAA